MLLQSGPYSYHWNPEGPSTRLVDLVGLWKPQKF